MAITEPTWNPLLPQAGVDEPDSLGRVWAPTSGAQRFMVIFNQRWADPANRLPGRPAQMWVTLFDSDTYGACAYAPLDKEQLAGLIKKLQAAHDQMPDG